MVTTSKVQQPCIKVVSVTTKFIALTLEDGRVLKIPTDWFPRVAYASEADRQDYEVLGGRGVAWFNLGEDLTIDQVLKGQGSYESTADFEKWKAGYDQGQQSRLFSFLPDDVFDDVD